MSAGQVREVRTSPSFEERMERHTVNGMTGGLHENGFPLDMAAKLTAEIHALLTTIAAGFDGHDLKIQDQFGPVICSALNGVAYLTSLANFYIAEAEAQRGRRTA